MLLPRVLNFLGRRNCKDIQFCSNITSVVFIFDQYLGNTLIYCQKNSASQSKLWEPNSPVFPVCGPLPLLWCKLMHICACRIFFRTIVINIFDTGFINSTTFAMRGKRLPNLTDISPLRTIRKCKIFVKYSTRNRNSLS